jgi:nitrate reductase NapE component
VRSAVRVVLRTGAAAAFVLAVAGWPLLALAIVGALWILVRLEARP